MSEWQPIETAPKDGRTVLIYQRSRAYRAARYQPIVTAYWHQPANPLAVGFWCMGTANIHEPTHWMPLPPPPKVGTEDAVLTPEIGSLRSVAQK